MRNPHLKLLVGLSLLLSSAIGARGQSGPPIVLSGECEIRKRATKIVTPNFPEETVRANAQGVVDVFILFGNDGKAAKIEIIDSPHPLLSEATTDALKQWEVEPYQIRGQSAELRGEIRFYFKIANGVGRVEAPPHEEQHTKSDKYKARYKKDGPMPKSSTP